VKKNLPGTYNLLKHHLNDRAAFGVVSLFLSLFALAGSAWGAASAKPSMNLSVAPQKIWPGESCLLRVQVKNADIDTPPDMSYLDEEFEVEYQGTEPMSHSIRITVNGKTTVTEDRGMTFLYRLTPKQGGTIQIEPPLVKSGGALVEADPVLLRVVEPEDQNAPVDQKAARLEVKVTPEKIYPLTPITITLSVYLKQDFGKQKPVNPMRYTDENPLLLTFAWGLDEPLPNGIVPNEEFSQWIASYLNSHSGFVVNHIHSNNPFFLFGEGQRPLTFLPEGEIVKSDGDTDKGTSIWRYDFSRGFTAEEAGEFDLNRALLKGQVNGRDIYAATPRLKLTVNEIPNPRPEGYIGVVGSARPCRVEAQLSSSEAGVGQTLSLVITLAGDKGKTDLAAPDLASAPQLKSRFKVYPPTEEQLSGAVRWTWSLRPLTPGDAPFPSISLSYFDAAQGEFRTLYTEEMPLTVNVGSADLSSFAADEEPNANGAEKTERGIYGNRRLGRTVKTYSPTELLLFAGTLYAALLVLGGGKYIRRRKIATAGSEAELLREGEKRLRRAFVGPPDQLRQAVVAAFLTPVATRLTTRLDAVTRGDIDILFSSMAGDKPDGETERVLSDLRAFFDRLEEQMFAGHAGSVSESETLELYRCWQTVLRRLGAEKGRKFRRAKIAGFLLALAIPLLAGCRADTETQERFDRAVRLFDEAEKSEESAEESTRGFRQSAAIYEGLLAEGKRNGPILYNLGNAYYRAGNPARALSAWRRAERYMPTDKALKANIAALRPDATAEKKTFLETVLFWRGTLSRPMQEMLFVLLTLLTFLLVAVWIVRPGKRPGRLVCAAATAFVLSLLLFGTLAADHVADTRRGILREDAELRKGSGPGYEAILSLDKLSECRLEEARGNWLRVKTVDGTSGWVEAEKVLTP
jgi:tetratricopeptide (TPR) repeat protein